MSGDAPPPRLLRRLRPDQIHQNREPVVPQDVLLSASEIIEAVRVGGEAALRELAERFDGLAPDAPILLPRSELDRVLAELPESEAAVLRRTGERIRAFAEGQKACVTDLRTPVLGGEAGDRLVPVRTVGCYAPGGRYPLPSTVLMTAIPARVAGVEAVWVASPRPDPVLLAAASVAQADGVLVLGGAHAVAAMAYGTGPVPRCDMVVGPGSDWVTAAKLLLSGVVGIDLLAGPSELVVLASREGNATLIAADLLAQAEHDPRALPIVVSTSADLLDRVDAELERQLDDLSTAITARASLQRGFAVVAAGREEAVACCQALAPEHLELHGGEALSWADELDAYGALFIGEATAEVFGDYGVGPNHTLPTGGTARFTGGLSVLSFLRRPTWVRVEDPVPEELVRDAAALARMEGLEAHARAAELRLSPTRNE